MKSYSITYRNKQGQSVAQTIKASDPACALGLLLDFVEDLDERGPVTITAFAARDTTPQRRRRVPAADLPALPDGVLDAYEKALGDK